MMRYRDMNQRRRSEDVSSPGGIWLITFTDTIALMLTFFVMTYAMSNPREETWQGITHTLQDNFNRFYGGPLGRGAQDAISIGRVDFNRALDLGYLENLLVAQLQDQPSLEGITLRQENDSLVLSFEEETVFEPGMDALNETGRARLYALTDILSRMKNRIEINARMAPDASGWRAALAKAASVSAGLLDAGYTRPVLIRTARAPEEETARIDIVIMEDDGKRVTVFDIGAP